MIQEILNKKVNDKIIEMRFDRSIYNFPKEYLQPVRENQSSEELLDLYQRIIDGYGYKGNYLILLFFDKYDVPKVAADGIALEDSEDVYDYMICAICPVTLERGGLQADENGLRTKIRRWIVSDPDCGFVWPAFIDREPDEEEIMYYTSKPDNPDHHFMELGLVCYPEMTAKEKRLNFEYAVRSINNGKQEEYLQDINEKIALMVLEGHGKERIDINTMYNICMQANIEDGVSRAISEAFRKEFKECLPEAQFLVNNSVLKKLDERRNIEKLKDTMKEAAVLFGRDGNEEMKRRIWESLRRLV
jgi:hypothetical protein